MTQPAYLPLLGRLTTTTGNVAYCASRVYPLVLPQDPTLPAETFQVISAQREHLMGGDPGEVHARVQVDIYDSTYAGTASGAKWVMESIDRFCGTASGVQVFDIFFDNEREAFVDKLEGADRRVWRRILDFQMHYKES